MAADLPHKGTKGKRDAETAAADWLFESDAPAKPAEQPRHSEPVSGAGEGFDHSEGYGLEAETIQNMSAASIWGPKPAPAPTAAPAAPESKQPDPAVLVEEVWTRRAEWGPTLLVVAGWLALVFVFFQVAFNQESYGYAFLGLLLGGLVAIVLCYPILITLERPVRLTPEPAVRDYYGSLAHHRPHFRRMWLLLSTAGRISPAFGSYEGFKAYWAGRLRELRDGRVGSFTPLVFKIEDFTSEKSAGKNRIDVEFKVRVSIRGRRSEGAIETIPMKIGLVRGPDKMWYLENGVLPSGREATTRVQAAS
jgi:hypothetical protein